MTDFFKEIIESAAQDAGNRAANAIASGMATATAVGAHDVEDVLRAATRRWLEQNVASFVTAELDRRKDEIFAEVSKALDKVMPMLHERIMKTVTTRFTDHHALNGITNAIFGIR